MTQEKVRTRALKKMKNILANTTPSQSLQKNEIQDAIDRLKEGKANDSNGIRAEQLKNCSDDTKKQDNLQRNFAARRRHTKKLAKDPNPGHLQRR